MYIHFVHWSILILFLFTAVVNIKAKPDGYLNNTGFNPVLIITTTPLCVEYFEYRITLNEVDGSLFWNTSTNQTTVDLPPLKSSNYTLEVFVYATYQGTNIQSSSFHLMISHINNSTHIFHPSILLVAAASSFLVYSLSLYS